MIKHTLFKQLFTAMTILAVIAFFGCEKKTEQHQGDVKSESVSPDTKSFDGTTQMNEPAVEEKVVVPDLKGTWTGTFNKRTTTLKITEQTDSSFSGKITINYQQVVNQEVKGTFSPSTMKVTMSDQIHDRYMGKYKGNITENGKTFSGTFTSDITKKQFSFNLTKK